MKKVLCRSLVLALGMALVASAASAKRGGGYAGYQRESLTNGVRVGPMDQTIKDAQFAGAALTTTALYNQTFDVGASCSEAGWTKVDGTSQIQVFWHVDDFAGANVNAGDSLAVLEGARSLWCGARFSTTGATCGYLLLPGYGNNWNQSWRTKTCLALAGNLDVSFLLETDSEPGYDATFLEYTNDCTGPDYTSWTTIDGGVGVWDDIQGPMAAGGSYAVGAGPVKVRIRFAADGGFSDEDANYDSHAGPSVVDNLVAEALPLENFNATALNATSTANWEGFGETGYGQHMALFSGISLVQQDACAKNLSCQWAAIATSSETYACGGFPLQTAVPKGNGEGQYLNNEVWSPSFALAGSGSVINLQFTVYRDMTLDGLVFYIWDVRSINAIGCQSAWRSRGFVYFGAQKDFLVNTFPVGDLIPASAISMRVRLGVIDQCGVWCGVFGTGACHAHAPLLDKVRVYRVDIFGPVYSTRDIDMFNDTFPANGTDTGIGRADGALSVTPSASPTIAPADSARIIVSDPITSTSTNLSGLATDNLGGTGNQPGGTNGNKAAYIWVHVNDSGVPAPAGKSGANLTDNTNYPFKDTQVADGKTWTRIQCWLRTASTSTFVIDLNDNLFQAGDVISFFFQATNTGALTSYASGSALNFVQSDLTIAAQNASEFTILPLNGNGTEGNDILYVDGMDGRGAQGFFDEAFGDMGLNPDRFDVRGPSSSVSNRPATRVTDVSQQLNANYQKIIWDAGDLTQSLGDGTGAPEKSNDYAMVNAFLGGLTTAGGVYICGDDYGQGLVAAAGASAVTFKSTYINFTLTTGNHRTSYGVAPSGKGGSSPAFGTDTWVIFGGCPLINDFDVLQPSGVGGVGQSRYDNVLTPPTVGDPLTGGDPVGYGEVSKITGNARVMISGYSFIYIRDDETDGTRDGSRHMRDILVYLANNPPQPTDAKPVAVNNLEQNYPNPFNPQTTIAFSLKDRARVKIDVYNVAGELVKTLLDETRAAGAYSDIRWDGRNAANQPVSSGVYFYKLVTNNYSMTKKMVLLK